MYPYGRFNADLGRLLPLRPHMRRHKDLKLGKYHLSGKFALMHGNRVRRSVRAAVQMVRAAGAMVVGTATPAPVRELTTCAVGRACSLLVGAGDLLQLGVGLADCTKRLRVPSGIRNHTQPIILRCLKREHLKSREDCTIAAGIDN